MTAPDPAVDSGSIDAGSTSPAESTGSQQIPAALNPNWEPVLKEMPEIFHEKLKGHFSQWDDNYRNLETSKKELEEKYSPYQQYIGVDPQAIQYGLTMLQRVQQSPLELYRSLEQYVRQQGLLEDPDQQTPEGEDLSDDPYRQEYEQRLAQLDEQQQGIQQYIQQQAYEAEVQTNEQEVDKQVQAVIAKYGDKAVNVDDLLMRMFVQAQQQNGQFDAEAAYQQQLGTFKALYAQQNGSSRPAPNVLPAGGSTAPTTEVNPAEMNEEQRAAYFKQLLDFANANAGG